MLAFFIFILALGTIPCQQCQTSFRKVRSHHSNVANVVLNHRVRSQCSNAAHVIFIPSHADVSLLSPGWSPGVLDEPVVLSFVSSAVAHSQHSVIQIMRVTVYIRVNTQKTGKIRIIICMKTLLFMRSRSYKKYIRVSQMTLLNE